METLGTPYISGWLLSLADIGAVFYHSCYFSFIQTFLNEAHHTMFGIIQKCALDIKFVYIVCMQTSSTGC